MSNRKPHAQRRTQLAAATALVLAAALAATPAIAGKANLVGLRSDGTYDRFIVKYRTGSAEQSNIESKRRSLNNAAAGGGSGKKLGLRHLRRMTQGADVVRADRKLDRIEAETLMRQIAVDPNVEYVEVDNLNQPLLTPNDPDYNDQWGYFGNYGIKANEAWDITSGNGVVVAVLDTGVVNHSDLNANVLPGYDFIDDPLVGNDGDGRDADFHDPGDWVAAGFCGKDQFGNPLPARASSWHGTHVAGTIAAVTNNGKGVAGVAHGARVLPVRVLGRCGGYDSDIADGITWASGGVVEGVPANANPAEVINMSLGGAHACSDTYKNAINAAVARGTTIVVAAGNSNMDASGFAPASCPNVITVGAIDSAGRRSVWAGGGRSNYGAIVDVAAPGSNIWSTANASAAAPGAENYVSMGGTSMAAPHVAGVVALIQSVAAVPKTPAQVEALIKANVTAFPVAPDRAIGTGILNAKAAVDAASGVTAPQPQTQTYSNAADYAIRDRATVDSPITVASRSGNAPGNASVSVNILHTYQADLRVDLVAPDGSLYNLHNRTGGSADNVVKTVTLNLSAEALNGTWKLRVNDNAAGDTGRIDNWSITF
jgi:serine protease